MKLGPRVWALGLCCSALLVFLITTLGSTRAPAETSAKRLDRRTAAGAIRLEPSLDDLHPKEGWLSAARSSDPVLQLEAPPRKKLLAVVGVQTGFTTNHDDAAYNYESRRKALRSTWFPPNQAALDKYEATTKILVTFVLGHSDDAQIEESVAVESDDHGGFMRLPVQEAYLSLTNKTLLFLSQTIATYEAQFIVKVDDDVFLRLDRLPAAIGQWTRRQSDYIGCMKNGEIYTSNQYRWYEPQHQLLGGGQYFTHAWGPIYILSWRIATEISRLNPNSLRFFNNEDVTVGGWMLALNSRHDDDRRLCEPSCTDSSIAVYDYPKCAGLCQPIKSMEVLWNSTECKAPALSGSEQTLLETTPIFKFEHQKT